MAETVVMKFGGTSVGSTDRISNVAKRVAAHRRRTGDRMVVVVSAMSGETDRLVELSRKTRGELRQDREYHQLLTSGEQVTAALTAMAIEREGIPSVSLVAFQLPLYTKATYGLHLIDSLDTNRLAEELDRGVVPVVAGFQGIDQNGNYTTLGRGGSDTTAVAVAAALKSCRCIIYTDVDGVYTALPQWCRAAKKLKHVSYDEMLELAGGGAKVLQARSVSLASKFRVPLTVASSFQEIEGTEIVEEYPGMEDAVVSGITSKSDQARVTVRNLPGRPAVAATIFGAIAKAGVVVDEIIQSESSGLRETIAFTIGQELLPVAQEALQPLIKNELPEASLDFEKGLAKISVVGEGMRTHAGVAAEVFAVLGKEGINIEFITTTEIKITVGVKQRYVELGVRALHEFFIEGGRSGARS